MPGDETVVILKAPVKGHVARYRVYYIKMVVSIFFSVIPILPQDYIYIYIEIYEITALAILILWYSG